MISKIIDSVGFAAMIIGFGGIAGNIEMDKSVTVPIIVMMVGALLLFSTSAAEVINDEKKNVHCNSNYHRDDARPFYLR